MTREEEIDKAGWEWFSQVAKYDVDVATAFLAGAKWADRTMIENACDWLYEFNRKQTNKMFGIVNTADVTINVAEFRKAMESGSSEIPNNQERRVIGTADNITAQDAHRCEGMAAQPPPIMAQCEGSLEPHQGNENIHRIVQHRKENYP